MDGSTFFVFFNPPTSLGTNEINEMIYFRLFKLVVLLLLVLLMVGCHKENNISEEYIQEVMDNAQHVVDAVSIIYSNTETIEEMSLHLDEIKEMENVENAWLENQDIAVKIKNGGIIKWCFFQKGTSNEKSEEPVNNIELMDFLINNKESGNKSLCEEKTACIAITTPFDESRLSSYDLNRLRIIANAFKECGYTIDSVFASDVSTEFLCNRMNKYGVNIIITHGNFNNSEHWIMTGITWGITSFIKSFKDWVSNKMQVWHIDEVRNNKRTNIGYWAVSESYLKKNMSGKFPQNSFLFAWACRTLYNNDSFARLFMDKGLGCYFGYDDFVSTYRAKRDLTYLMIEMLNNYSSAATAYYRVGEGYDPKLLLCPMRCYVTLREEPVGLFFANGKYVRFSPGNLAQGGGFVSNQWNYGGYFQWGQFSAPAGWRLPTKEEWWDLAPRYQGTVAGISGWISIPLFHFSLPEGCTLLDGYHVNNVYTVEQWKKMEEAGAVFLPSAGFWWAWNGVITDVGEWGCYWSATPYDDDYAWALEMSMEIGYFNIAYNNSRRNGYSIRLIQDEKDPLPDIDLL